MEDSIHLKKWNYEGDKVKLEYQDESIVYVKKIDFDRAFGCIVSAAKSEIVRDFAIDNA